MRSYLDACTLPTTAVGAVELPRLIMGIHPYDGCSYVDAQRDRENLAAFGQAGAVAQVIRCAVEEAGVTAAQVDHMLPVLDRLHLQAVWEAEQALQTQIGLVAYILIPITLDGELISESPRAHATFFAENAKLGGEAFIEHLRRDGARPAAGQARGRRRAARAAADGEPGEREAGRTGLASGWRSACPHGGRQGTSGVGRDLRQAD